MNFTERPEWNFSTDGFDFKCYYNHTSDVVEVRCESLNSKLSAKAGSIPKTLVKVLAQQIIKVNA